MRLEEIAYPVGSEPLAVYWRRRAIALLVLVILLYVIWPSSHPKKAGTPKPAVKTTTSPSPAPAAVLAGVACQPTDVTVSADADGSDYPAGTTPKIVISITNTSGHACNIDTSQRYLTISSGTDLWWSSRACPSGTQPKVSLAAAGVLKSSYTWGRKRQATSCAIGGEAPAATYLAQAHLGGIVTPGAVLRLR